MIIPLGSKRRQRGLELWAQAGEMLGVGKHADGGIIGSGGGTSKNIWDNTERLIEPISEETAAHLMYQRLLTAKGTRIQKK